MSLHFLPQSRCEDTGTLTVAPGAGDVPVIVRCPSSECGDWRQRARVRHSASSPELREPEDPNAQTHRSPSLAPRWGHETCAAASKAWRPERGVLEASAEDFGSRLSVSLPRRGRRGEQVRGRGHICEDEATSEPPLDRCGEHCSKMSCDEGRLSRGGRDARRLPAACSSEMSRRLGSVPSQGWCPRRELGRAERLPHASGRSAPRSTGVSASTNSGPSSPSPKSICRRPSDRSGRLSASERERCERWQRSAPSSSGSDVPAETRRFVCDAAGKAATEPARGASAPKTPSAGSL
jgi:hypothetical protein